MSSDDTRPTWLTEEEPVTTSTQSYGVTTTTGDQNQTSGGAPSTEMTTVAIGNDNNATNTKSAAALASEKTWNDYFKEMIRRDGRLLLATLIIIIMMNIPFVKWALYPFRIFSTWVHEFCHGMAAVMVGGKIHKLEIFPDTSGLATTSIPNSNRRGFVASAGYQGTAVMGCLLLMVRRTKRGPRSGTMAVAITMLLSVLFFIRNMFGIAFITLLGVLLAAVAWKLPSMHMRNVYIMLAVTTCLNAITSVQDLFGSNHVVNGEETEGTDAHTMADVRGGSSSMWAFTWLLLAFLLAIGGFLFAIPGPDEVADFTCCGVCQDLGLFKLCNAPGQRLLRKLFFGYPPEEAAAAAAADNKNSKNDTPTV